MSSDFARVLNSVPPLTRWMTTISTGLFLASRFNLLSLHFFCNYWPWTIGKFQLWRPFTAFFVTLTPFPMSVLFEIYFLYSYGRRVEENKFGNPAHFAFYLSFIAPIIIGLNYFTDEPVYLNALSMALTYTWAQNNTEQPVEFFFVSCKAKHLPILKLVFESVVGSFSTALISATGLVAAHLYLYLDTIYPRTTGKRSPLKIPRFFYTVFRNVNSTGPSSSQIQTDNGHTVHSTSYGSFVEPRDGSSGASMRQSEPVSRTTFHGSGHRLGK
ncbi:DER1-domain-containing protein [Nadsonia fulvescens var. elongata DSM 6958]|uniref:Derlin n=1 Tax=Nadsonia fulvescens var. elongata DSM 6958 TaxID=857566 RepID=A0A1E3PNC4_9ASCO|nr:DER1-domain-containing protein [Nadsonia fulvescens var. elongata DSM 6958]